MQMGAYIRYLTGAVLLTVIAGELGVLWYGQADPGFGFRPDQLPALQVGDLVLRSGTEAESLVIQELSDCPYSHIGMITSIEEGTCMVSHATTDDYADRQDQVILVTLEEFFAKSLARQGCILRFTELKQEELEEIASEIRKRTGEPFVLAGSGQPHLYCTTLIYDAIRKYRQDFKLDWTYLNIPFGEGDYLLPANFIEHKTGLMIYAF